MQTFLGTKKLHPQLSMKSMELIPITELRKMTTIFKTN
jgi:hypothetical protein